MMLKPRPIRTETDYRAALDQIERLFDAELNTPECDLLEGLIKRDNCRNYDRMLMLWLLLYVSQKF